MSNFLFDFDGTLADSLSAIVTITNRLAPEFGFRPTPLAEVEALKGLTARQLIRYSGIPLLKIPALLRRVRAELNQQGGHIAPCPGIPKIIRTLYEQHHTLAVVTSNAPATVEAFLAAHQLADCFLSVDGGGTLFRKGKLIVRCLEKHQLAPADTVYVGDEIRDIDAARFAGVRPVSVTWGFNSRPLLMKMTPDWLIDDPDRLLAIAEQLQAPQRP
ncbi:HAD hydrolase-like protein [Halomicronema sp. CCY15110]|uniref:HAD hydrolase-like protein n=1 Tax=Halomicronema sp. CCY15110 TaxID=2767773 RepID=UPI00194F1C01|nr:HAD hydrolase-like protein [Halomicronema sp. CCY15110]